MAFSMNKQREAHMNGKPGMAEGAGDIKDESGQHHPPHIHIHHDGHKTHVHIMHHNAPPEHHEHDPGDTEGISSHVHEHYGAAGGQPVSEGGPSPSEEEEF